MTRVAGNRLPSHVEPLTTHASRAIGGAWGRHAGVGRLTWWTPLRWLLVMTIATLLLTGTAAAAQETTVQRTIRVAGQGKVRTPPDIARLQYWVRGEGATPDAATATLAAKQKAIVGGLTGLLGAGTEATTGEVTVLEVRDRGCDDTRGYGSQPRLSQGACPSYQRLRRAGAAAGSQ